MYGLKCVSRSRQITFHKFDMHVRKLTDYALTNSTKTYFGSFLDTFEARSVQLCLRITSIKFDMLHANLMAFVKWDETGLVSNKFHETLTKLPDKLLSF